jgi:hypothetical protein
LVRGSGAGVPDLDRSLVHNCKVADDLADSSFLPDEYYDAKLNQRAPVHGDAYGRYERFDDAGNLTQVTTYDRFGDRIRQFDVGYTARHGEGYHTFDYDARDPRHAMGGGIRSPHTSF